MVATKFHLPTGARNLKAVHTSPKTRTRDFQPRSRGRRNKTHEQRIQDLLNDPLVHKPSLGSFRVGCLACGQRLQLDRRGGRPFYSSNWLKHRNGGCQKASEAQQKINIGQSFEVAAFWKGWTRKRLTVGIIHGWLLFRAHESPGRSKIGVRTKTIEVIDKDYTTHFGAISAFD
ncbi:hypothetical protein PM082_009833 [Marasmius tenuissimus]|nr:hypothetical protein PM082_009833 [Marasmius tenuissimus]